MLFPNFNITNLQEIFGGATRLKKKLIHEIQKYYLFNKVVFLLLTYLVICSILWRQSLHDEQTRLLRITRMIENTLTTKERDRFSEHFDQRNFQQFFQPSLQSILELYSNEYTAGFYSKRLDQVVAVYSKDPMVRVIGKKLPLTDPIRQLWRRGAKPRYALLWSEMRGCWILKCDNPLVVNGKVLGHTFANVKLISIIALFSRLGLIYLGGFFVSGLFSLINSRRLIRKLQKNLSQLQILESDLNLPAFDYEEFQAVANRNRQLYRLLQNKKNFQEVLLENFPWGYALLHTNGCVLEINRNGALSLGFQPEELIGTNIIGRVIDKTAITQVIQNQIPVSDYFRYRRPDTNQLYTYFSCCFPIVGDLGESAVIAWFIDVSDTVVAQNELAKSNQRVSEILKSITDTFYSLDNNWNFTFINRTTESIFSGKNPLDILGKSIWNVYPELSGTLMYSQYHQAIQSNQSVHFEMKSAAEPSQWFEVHAYPSGEGLSVYLRNITAKKEAERIRNQLITMVESSEDAIFTTDPTGIINSWNLGAAKMYGYKADEIIGHHCTKLVPIPEHYSMLKLYTNIALGIRISDTIEAERVRRDGSLVAVSIKRSLLLDENGKIIGVSSIHRNITESKQYQEALKSERERLNRTLNSLSDGVITTDRHGRILLMNQAAETLTGWHYPDWFEKPLPKIFYLINDRTSEPYTDLVMQTLGAENSLHISDTILVDNRLREIPLQVCCTPLRSAQSEQFGIVVVFQDITEKLMIEAELLKAEKLESLGVLAGGIAHDFNNILTAILSNLQLATSKLDKGENIRKYLFDSMEAAYKASDLTKQLLTFSKGNTPIKKVIALGQLIERTVTFALRGSNVKANFEIAANLQQVEADEGQLIQVINNITINAKQAMVKGGTFTVSVVNHYISSGEHLHAGEYIKITFSDKGVGIPDSLLKKIFDPFFTTKKEGTGLGLATSYSIIHNHNGNIEVKSRINQGTSFIIFLPVAKGQTPINQADEEVAVAMEGIYILLMDDEAAIRQGTSELLRELGYRVETVADGEAAIVRYQQVLNSENPFDIVILDLTVPGGMGGQAAISYLRDINPQIKTIVSSGYAEDPIISEFERYGFSGVVTKPYKLEELNRVILRLVGKG